MMQLNPTVIDSIVGRAWSRSLWIDIDTVGMSHNLVIRGEDKVKSGAKPSEAASERDKSEHKPALIWTDIEAKAIPYVLATFDDLTSAEVAAAQLIQFYADAGEEIPYSARAEALSSNSKELLPIILSIFGTTPNSNMLQPGRLGTYADYVAGTWRKRQPKRKLQSDSDVLAEAKKIFEKMDDAKAAALMGIDVDVYRKMKTAMSAFAV